MFEPLENEEPYRANLVPFISNIKQCPFCGQWPDSTDPDFCYPINVTYKNESRIYRAGCIESAGGCGAEVLGDSVDHAVEKWNTRVESTILMNTARQLNLNTEVDNFLRLNEELTRNLLEYQQLLSRIKNNS